MVPGYCRVVWNWGCSKGQARGLLLYEGTYASVPLTLFSAAVTVFQEEGFEKSVLVARRISSPEVPRSTLKSFPPLDHI